MKFTDGAKLGGAVDSPQAGWLCREGWAITNHMRSRVREDSRFCTWDETALDVQTDGNERLESSVMKRTWGCGPWQVGHEPAGPWQPGGPPMFLGQGRDCRCCSIRRTELECAVEGMKTVKGLEGKPCEEWLRSLGLFSLEETEGRPHCNHNFPVRGRGGASSDLLSLVSNHRTERMA